MTYSSRVGKGYLVSRIAYKARGLRIMKKIWGAGYRTCYKFILILNRESRFIQDRIEARCIIPMQCGFQIGQTFRTVTGRAGGLNHPVKIKVEVLT